MLVRYQQIKPHLPKFAKKGTTRSREVPITKQMAQNTFMGELTPKNF